MRPLYGDKARLMYHDTDSFVYHINSGTFYKDVQKDIEKLGADSWFDTSGYPKCHPCWSPINNKVIGKMKDEMDSKKILEAVCLKPKMYSITCEDSTKDKKRAKGIGSVFVRKHVTHQDYVKVLKGELRNHMSKSLSIRSHRHELYTDEIHKKGLDPTDTKRVVLKDGIKTLPFGHFLLSSKKWCSQNIMFPFTDDNH